ncbi:hypothetical protein DY218_11875 [Streptomyces triticagri]|uniref:Cold shock domain-containing protein n=1 Tax=Streptomyces triticagri TaxID=2293568 RepID=A0A372M7W4_9ACTN|nr:hypothetical protein [Streptomyces triticagri]RFU86605.1 hypothetical protein DY218_11875 [Streptomyces triticagri]
MTSARFGVVVDRSSEGDGTGAPIGMYVLRDEEDGHHYSFSYTDIVTEGFRTIRIGERVRFHLAELPAWRAEFVIRLDQPDPAAYYP